jgi:hypothetical protein
MTKEEIEEIIKNTVNTDYEGYYIHDIDIAAAAIAEKQDKEMIEFIKYCVPNQFSDEHIPELLQLFREQNKNG